MRDNKRVLMVLIAAAFATGSIGCSIQTETILEMQEGSELVLAVAAFPAQNLPLEGGTVMNIDVSIGLFDLIFGNIGGDITVGELLFATPPFAFLGIPALFTEEVCVVPAAGPPSTGQFSANIYQELASFDLNLTTIALIGNENLAAALPGGGLEFPFDLSAEVPMSLGDMLGLLTGSGDLEITQDVDLDLMLDVSLGGPPITLPAHVGGSLTLAGTDAFPTSQLLDDCIAFLNE